MERIDFVIPWVDGNDPIWKSEFVQYKQAQGDFDAGTIRYRDWDNLQYLFRGIEKFAPWVGRVHLITYGHLPSWLNTSHPKLNIVNHKDYIPEEYLPTFSSIPIELNIHRIKDLSENFVLFNDDTFIIKPIKPTRFFKCGLPRDIARLAISSSPALEIINKQHVKNQVIAKNWYKWFNPHYRLSDLFKTMTLMPWQAFYGFKITHMIQPFLRSTFEKMWQQEFDALDATCKHHIRTKADLTQYLMRYEQLATGKFSPYGCYDACACSAREREIDGVCDYITRGKGVMICINDADDIISFEKMRDRLKEAFNTILPDKSNYEL